MKLYILNHKNAYRRTLNDEDAKRLILDEYCDNSQNILKNLNDHKQRIRCQCGVVMHSVHNTATHKYFLRRNPSQDSGHDRTCPLWSAFIPQEVRKNQSSGLCAGTTNEYLINDKTDRIARSSHPSPKNRPATNQKQPLRYRKIFGFLYGMFEQLGINQFPNNVLGRKANWEDVYDFLQNTKYRNLFWCPSKRCKGGAVSLNKKILQNWSYHNRVGHGLLLGIIDAVPLTNKILIKKWSQDQYPIKCNADLSKIALVGESGPYFLLAVCTAQTTGKIQFATPILHKMILQSVKSWNSWIPVDRDHHRIIANSLFKRKEDFVRPLSMPEGQIGIRPTFILPNKGIVAPNDENKTLFERIYNLPLLDVATPDLVHF